MTHPLRMRVCLPVVAAIAAALALPAAAAAVEVVPSEVLVRYESGSSTADRADVREETGTRALEGLGMARAQLLKITDGDSVAATVRQLEAQPEVAYAEPNYIRRPAFTPDDPLFDSQWGLQNLSQPVNGISGAFDADIDAPEAWDLVTGDLGTVVAVMDTGADMQHPDLAAELWTNPADASHGYDFIDDDADPTDLSGHGTHVSGIAMAEGDNAVGVSGVSQHASLMSLRICGAFSSGCPDSALIDAINYAADNGARVVNGSIAGGGGNSLVTAAMASHPNTLYVFAAGNDGTNNDALTTFPCNADQGSGYAANNLICVAATNQSDGRASFSNYGASSVDLGAPGVNILSTSSYIGVFSDDFESGDISGWTNAGASTWAASSEPPHSGSFGITDSPGGNYAPDTVNEVTSNAVTLPSLDPGGARACELDYFRDVRLGSGDSFVIEVLLDGSVEETGVPQNNTSRNGFIDFGSQFDAGGQVKVRLRLTSNASGVADGVHVDNVELLCHGSPSDNGYEYLNGTSMATPMVTGAAALLFSDNAGASASQVKNALLDSVDQIASLAGVTKTGGRLNLYRALIGDSNPAGGGADTSAGTPGTSTGAATTTGFNPNTFFTRKPGRVVRTRDSRARVVFKFGSDEAGSSFRCLLDSGGYKPCSKRLVRRLLPGRHVLKVKALSWRGIIDPTAAVVRFRVKRVED